LRRSAFIEHLIQARVLIGNSSSGIIEAPFVGTPSVNVGSRQAGRLRGGPTVLEANEAAASIRAALRKALRIHGAPGRSEYGDGTAGRRIAGILSRVTLDDKLRRKLIAY
jgi:UDP-N-acetylglucosamine 2-epimerase